MRTTVLEQRNQSSGLAIGSGNALTTKPTLSRYGLPCQLLVPYPLSQF